MANHKLSIDTTLDPCKFSLDSTFNAPSLPFCETVLNCTLSLASFCE
jgi:hypothetical protein